ncbi:MAG: DEAD/DEAH box helicase [Armatimonadota bacterium]|nr:DEAD/DEAH box helicase [Armatimonadota bacterium]
MSDPSTDVRQAIEWLRGNRGESIIEHGITEPREARFQQPERPLNPKLLSILAESGIEQLYAHQATAFDLAEAGHDVLVTTGTSSGKTLCYNLPVLQRTLREPAARALYLFPTKALAQDQLGKLRKLAPPSLECDTYDGDTPKSARAAIRQSAHIVLTNPDMLHLAILPNFSMWARFFRSLRYVVVDEMHAYSGVFGSHVALIMRRLRRLCEWQGTTPQFIACSATIANGPELFEDLIGKVPSTVSDDGAVVGRRHLVMWNPPESNGRRMSSHAESAQLLASLVWMGLRTITFTRSRIAAEIVLRYAREGLQGIDPELARRLESYRAGYTAKERREIEKRLFGGDLLGITATDAMELGIDVGDLDAVVMDGYPGSIGSLRQQTGRAGRSGRDAVGFLVARDNPLEQYYMRHPELLLAGKAEAVRVHPGNPFILSAQLKCAAHERPIAPNELEGFPPESIDMLEQMEETGDIVRRAGLWIHPSHDSPAAQVDIRGGGANQYTIFCSGEVLGTLEEWRAFQTAHVDAVYLHRGDQYVVQEFDEATRTVRVVKRQVDYYTQSIIESEVQPTAELKRTRQGNAEIRLCAMNVRSQMTGFRRKHLHDDSVLATVDCVMPAHEMATIGLEITIDHQNLDPRDVEAWTEGVHAAEHLLVGLAPSFVQCETRDLGSTFHGPDLGRNGGTIFVFDGIPGGIGFSEALLDSAEAWFERVAEQLGSCTCENGCPSCVLSPWCPMGNDRIGRLNGLVVARFLARL